MHPWEKCKTEITFKRAQSSDNRSNSWKLELHFALMLCSYFSCHIWYGNWHKHNQLDKKQIQKCYFPKLEFLLIQKPGTLHRKRSPIICDGKQRRLFASSSTSPYVQSNMHQHSSQIEDKSQSKFVGLHLLGLEAWHQISGASQIVLPSSPSQLC